MNAVAHIHIKPPRFTKERFVLRGAAAIPVAGRVILGIRLRFHNHAPQQTPIDLAFHQPAAHQFRTDQLGRTAEEGLRQSREIGIDGLAGDGTCFK